MKYVVERPKDRRRAHNILIGAVNTALILIPFAIVGHFFLT